MCVVCVSIHETRFYRRTQKPFSSLSKIDFWLKLHPKIIFRSREYFIRIFHRFPFRLFESAARLVPLEPVRARKCRPGKGSADSSSDLSPRANRNEYDHFSIYSKNRESEEIKGFSFPLATRFPSSKIFFRIFDHFCEHLSSWASSLNEGKSERDPIFSKRLGNRAGSPNV